MMAAEQQGLRNDVRNGDVVQLGTHELVVVMVTPGVAGRGFRRVLATADGRTAHPSRPCCCPPGHSDGSTVAGDLVTEHEWVICTRCRCRAAGEYGAA